MGCDRWRSRSRRALRYGLRVDAHCDEIDDEQSRFVEVLATQAARSGLREKVTASHTTAMGSYNSAYSYKLQRILARSGINLVCNPMVNLHLQGRFDAYPKRRGLTQVKEMLRAGVNVAFGHDDVMDPWYPLGTGNPLQVAHIGRARDAADGARRDRRVLPDGDLPCRRGARPRRRATASRPSGRRASLCCLQRMPSMRCGARSARGTWSRTVGWCRRRRRSRPSSAGRGARWKQSTSSGIGTPPARHGADLRSPPTPRQSPLGRRPVRGECDLVPGALLQRRAPGHNILRRCTEPMAGCSANRIHGMAASPRR